MTIALLLIAQTAPVPVEAPPAPIAAPAAMGCAAAAGAVDGAGATLPPAFDGTSVKSVKALGKLREKAGDGRVLVIEGGDYSGWDFRKIKLNAICFRGTKLANSEWSGMLASGMGFIGADLSGAKMAGTALPGVLFRTATLAGADMRKADLSAGRIDGGWNASLAGWQIDGANLTGFRFACGVTEQDGCPFDRKGISARGADFSQAVFEGFGFWDAALDGAKVEGVDVRLENAALLVAAQPAQAVTLRHGGRQAVVPGPVAAAIGRALSHQPAPAAAPAAPMVQPIPGAAAAPKPAANRLLFVSDTLEIAPATGDPAWPAALRTLLGLAPSHLLVTIGRDGAAFARGTATGETGGQCRIDAGPLYPGALNVYVAAAPRPPRSPKSGVPAVIVDGDMASIASDQAVATGPARVVSCAGGDAKFGTMRRVVIDDVLFDALWGEARPAG